ncbi:MAG TPA: sigma-70 family RNA polymerase sigma factor [Candidatus Ozemobacteraceae bacterium]|nr:sigma-70 family RNA polymerase sigma factor [Candidatus Ozemobacteraceae bacterium]
MTNNDHPSAAESDETLVVATLNGHKNAFALLVQKYQQRIFGMAWSYTHQREEALDLTQDIFFAVYQSLPRFDPARPFVNWLLRISSHHCFQFNRRRKMIARHPVDPIVPEESDPLDFHVHQEAKNAVLACFHELDDDHKMVVWLYYFLDRSCRDISEILEISVDLVKIRLFRARREMGTKLTDPKEQPLKPKNGT